jgi:hypothetical protein
MMGGKASGNEEAEKKDIDSDGDEVDAGDGKRMLVESDTFSGMYMNDGIAYLIKFKIRVMKVELSSAQHVPVRNPNNSFPAIPLKTLH